MLSSLLLGTLQLVCVLLLSAALGVRVLALCRVPLRVLHTWEKPVLGIALGLGFWQFLPFVLFALHLGKPFQIVIGAGLLAVLLSKDIVHILRAVKPALLKIKVEGSSERGFAVLMGVLLTILFLRALLPAIDGDVSSYHLPSVLRYLRAGGFIYLPTLTPTNWQLGVQMLYALLLSFNAEAPTSLIPYLCGVLTLGVMALWAYRLVGVKGVVWVLGLYLVLDRFSYQGFWYQMSSSLIDLGLTLFATCGAYTLYRAMEGHEEERGDWLRLSALFAGLAGTTKLTGIWVVVSLGVVLCIALRKGGASPAKLLRHTGQYVLIAMCLIAPWLVKTWVLTGNPLYPMFYRVFGGIEWTAEGWALYQRSHLIWNTPAGKMPTPQVLAQTHLQIAGLGTLLGLLFMVWSRKKQYAIPAMFAAAFFICISVGNFFHLRFLMPSFPCIMVCFACLLTRFQRLYTWFLLLVVWVFVGKAVVPAVSFFPKALEMVTKLETRREAFKVSDQYEMAEYINTKLPSEARVLLGCYDYAPLLYRVEGLWPDLQDSIHYDSQARLVGDLKRLHVTYLLLNPTYPDFCAKSHSCRERLEREIPPLVALAQAYGHALYTAKGFTLYRLDW